MSKKLTTAEMGRMNIDQYKESDKLPLVVVLDNVRSQHNVGAVFRTADAMRIERVILCGICCCPPNAEIHKTALGAEESVEWQYYKNTLDAVHALQAEGYTVFAVEQAHDSVTLEDVAESLSAERSVLCQPQAVCVLSAPAVFRLSTFDFRLSSTVISRAAM